MTERADLDLTALEPSPLINELALRAHYGASDAELCEYAGIDRKQLNNLRYSILWLEASNRAIHTAQREAYQRRQRLKARAEQVALEALEPAAPEMTPEEKVAHHMTQLKTAMEVLRSLGTEVDVKITPQLPAQQSGPVDRAELSKTIRLLRSGESE